MELYMNKTKLALIAAVVLATTLTFTACEEKKKQDGSTATEAAADSTVAASNGSGGGNLLECFADENGKCTRKFEYDKQNRLVKIDDETITYADNLITAGTKKFVIKGNTVTIDEYTLTIDKNGYIVSKIGGLGGCGDDDKKDENDEPIKVTYREEYHYEDGNLTRMNHNGGDCEIFVGGSYNYEYDSQKSPFSASNTPKWLLQHLLEPHNASKNNVIETSIGGSDCYPTYKYQYEYASNGLPTKETGEIESFCDSGTFTTRYIYR
jgi:hypothetical protein